jgi:TRAP-type uncharacterized transport system substrate-binding protein
VRLAIRLAAALVCALACLLPAEARRVALVIGNAEYKIGPLANPVNDAEAIAEAFAKGLGFDKVILRKNLAFDGFRAALAEIAEAAAGAEVAAVFFAGHGTELAGKNYLLPVDARLAKAADLSLQAIALDTVLEQIAGATRLKLVILDACRNNLFPMAGAKRSVVRGLSRIEPEENTLVVYAAKDGTTADDGAGQRHSPFTAALLKHIATPGLEVSFVFRRVRDDVVATTSPVQTPHVYGTLGGKELYLKPPTAVTSGPQPPSPGPSPAEIARFCQSIAANPSLAVVESLLAANRGTPLAGCIEARIAELKKLALAIPPAPKEPQPSPTVSTLAPTKGALGRKSLRWTTSQPGSYGYSIAAAMAKVLEQALGSDYTVTVQPYPSPTAAMKAAMNGEGEIAYIADIGMSLLAERVGPFKDFKPTAPELVHTLYAYPMESMMATTVRGAARYRCWRDFSGQPVYFTQAGFQNWLNWQRIFRALGYNFQHVQIDSKANADALERGTIVGSVVYTTAGRALPPYWKETEIRMDFRVVNPCPDEVAKLKAAGLAVVDVEARDAFTRSVGPTRLQGVPILFGYNVRSDVSADVVYKMLKAFYDGRGELARIDPGFGPLAKDFIGMQVLGINANPQIAVHAGLAKLLREHKARNDKWKIAPRS